MITCKRCGHVITKNDVEFGVADNYYHDEKLCRTLDKVYGRRKKW